MTVYAAAEIGTLYNDDDRSISEKYGKQIAPYFKIDISDKSDNLIFSSETLAQVGGYDLNGLIINDVQMEEDIEGADAINVTINNPRVDLQNSVLFDIGNNFDLYMGYDGRAPFYMMRGIIVEVQPEFPADAIPTIKIKAYDKSYFMMEEGKAEIVPEGSAWWERRTQASISRTPLQETQRYNTAYQNTDLNDRQLAENQRLRELAEQQGQPLPPNIGAEEAMDNDIDLTLDVVEGGEVRFPAGEEDDPFVNFDAAERITGVQRQRQVNRSAWQRQQFGRRSRQAGKVWRGKTDSEIVAAIFQSYDIVPYVEATGEIRRTYTGRNRPTDLPGNPSQPRINDRLSTLERELEEAEARRADLEEAAQMRQRRRAPVNENEAAELTETVELITEIQTDISDVMDEQEYRRSINTGSLFDENDSTSMVFHRPTPGFESIRVGEESLSISGGDESYTFTYTPQFGVDQTPPQLIRETRPREVTQRAGTSDWDFILKLAKQHGFIVFVFFHIESHRWIGYWGPEGNVPQFRKYTFRYNAGDETTLGTVRPNVSAKNQSTEIDLIYVDPVNGRENRLRVALDNLNENMEELRVTGDGHLTREPIGNGPEVVLRIHGERVRVRADRRFHSADDARTWLMSFWLEHARDFYFIEGDTIIGIPEMRAREYHMLEGIGRYSGEFFITQTRHSMIPGQGYKTTFVGRAKSPFTSSDEQGDDLLVVDQTILGEIQPLTDSSETG